jgi:chorismate mutase
MKNANEMRTIANNHNAQFEINLADDIIDRKVEEVILRSAKKGEYDARINAETLAIAVRYGMQNGNEIVERAKYSGVLERAKELAEANGYKAELVGDYKVVIRWNIEE